MLKDLKKHEITIAIIGITIVIAIFAASHRDFHILYLIGGFVGVGIGIIVGLWIKKKN